ncbi:MAG TPA: hypothetical protein VGO68_01080 [Pyrinomonadaceae bacterium]|jgi:hypothetical protein|nr:hypothetical protein [Pyrinomonadaceae bacterium]
MKTLLNRIAFALLITALASVSALSKGKTEKVTFPSNIKVNGTLVKEGVYDLKFDDKTSELTIMKGSKVIARATTSTAKRDRKAQSLEIRTSGSGDDTQLTSVTFGGSDESLVLSGSQASR